MKAIKRYFSLFTARFGSLHQTLREVKLTFCEQFSLRDVTQDKHHRTMFLNLSMPRETSDTGWKG